jgi:hypothetical protein
MDINQLYIDFIMERQYTFTRRLTDVKYVSDMLSPYKFTNVYRCLDRVSQYMLRTVMYEGDQKPLSVLKRLFLFDQFKTIAFWETLKESKISKLSGLPDMVSTYNSKQLPLFTSAYVVPGKAGEPKALTIANRCRALSDLDLKLAIEARNINSIYEQLKTIDGIGDFLASQVCFDFLLHESTAGWEPLYALGVGAVRGAKKLGLDPTKPEECLKQVLDIVDMSPFKYLIAKGQLVKLSPADAQNTLCEFDKFCRIACPELASDRKNIKGRHSPNPDKLSYVIPTASGLVPLGDLSDLLYELQLAISDAQDGEEYYGAVEAYMLATRGQHVHKYS